MNFPFYMARRLYKEERGSKRVSLSAVLIATSGLALGVAIMIISVSVVLGFKREVRNKVTGMGSHIQIVNYESLYSPEYRPIEIPAPMVQQLRKTRGVKHVQRFCLKTGMLKTDESFHGVMFRGLDETYDLTYLRSCLKEGTVDSLFSSKRETGNLVISERLAKQLGLEVDSRVYAYFFDGRLRARRFTVRGIYSTNMNEYDNKLVFCDFRTAHNLLGFEPNQCSGAEVLIKDFEELDEVSARVVHKVNHQEDAYGNYYTSVNIRQMNQHIFSWLDLLDTNIVVILILMIAVAGFTVMSGLLIIILERTQFVGIMKALGASNTSLRHLFICYSLFIVLKGLAYGNIIGLGLCLLQQEFGLVKLDASTYYLESAPIMISWTWVAFINVVTLVISVLVLVIPSFIVSHIHPARSIRFE